MKSVIHNHINYKIEPPANKCYAKAVEESHNTEKIKTAIFEHDKLLTDYKTLMGIREFNNIVNIYYNDYKNESSAKSKLNVLNVALPEVRLNDVSVNDNNKYDVMNINNRNEKNVDLHALYNNTKLQSMDSYNNICNDNYTYNIDVSEYNSYPNYDVTEIKPTFNIEDPLINLNELETVNKSNKDENSIEKEFVDLDNLNIISEVNETNEYELVHNTVNEYVKEFKPMFNLDFNESSLNLDSPYLIKGETETAFDNLDSNITQTQNDECKFEIKTDKYSIAPYINANEYYSPEPQCMALINNPLQNIKRKLDTNPFTDVNKSICKQNKIKNDNNIGAVYEHKFQDNNHNYANVTKITKELNNDTIDLIILSSDDESQNDDKIDIISISSDEIVIMPDQSDSEPDGYHSSDFEFINEDEAKNDNYNTLKAEIDDSISKEIILDYFYTPERKNENNDNYRENHITPQGEDFVNLFNGNYDPLPTYCVENKSISKGMAMNVGFDGVGFDVRMLRENPGKKACKEALDCEKKILSIYPFENRRKRRRRY